MPVRRIPPNRRSLTGLVVSQRQGRMVASESSLERDFYILLDFDINVDKYIEQPVIIEYLDMEGGVHTYTPDVLVYYREDIVPAKGMKPILCEVKYRQDLFTNWREYKPKIRAGRAYARAKGWQFKLITECEVRTPYLENAKFLRPYRNLEINWGQANLLLKQMRELREADPESLLIAVAADRWQQAEMLPVLWHLIVKKMIGVDLTKRLTMHSRIFVKL
jgi:hypothetical protein